MKEMGILSIVKKFLCLYFLKIKIVLNEGQILELIDLQDYSEQEIYSFISFFRERCKLNFATLIELLRGYQIIFSNRTDQGKLLVILEDMAWMTGTDQDLGDFVEDFLKIKKGSKKYQQEMEEALVIRIRKRKRFLRERPRKISSA